MIGPTNSWINRPNIASSCGGRPTTVNGQIASAAMIHVLHAHHGKLVRQAIVAQVIAEWPLGQQPLGLDEAGEAEIGLGVDRQLAGAADHRQPPPAQHAGQRPARRLPSGMGITAATVIAGGPPTKTFTSSFLAAADGRRMVRPDAAVDLIVDPHLAVRLVLPAGNLHAIHAQVGRGEAGLVGILGIDLGQRNVGAAVVGPATSIAAVGPASSPRPAPDRRRPSAAG